MANPFPGMDPYLEGDLWTSVHSDLLAEFVRQLSPQIKPKYVAITARRVIVTTPDPLDFGRANRWPDVGLVATGQPDGSTESVPTSTPLILEAALPESITLRSLEIRDVAHRQLVTAVELLSPTNKRGDGLEEYAGKRAEVCRSPAHLLEIDLLRVGDRFPLRNPLPSVAYAVFLSRAGQRPRVEAWPIPLDQPLPRVPVPLAGSDPDAYLDLQAALQTVYDIVGYDLLIDYCRPPTVPLPPEQEAWADALLRRAGKRS